MKLFTRFPFIRKRELLCLMSTKTVSAALVKELREKSNAPMMDCKKALTEVDGDLSKAMDWLRAKGIAKSSNQSSRTSSEGLIAVHSSQGKACVLEVNSETDFVGRNKDFQSFVASVARSAHAKFGNGPISIPSLLHEKLNNDEECSIMEALGDITTKIREQIVIRRAHNFEVTPPSVCTTYVHGKVGQGHVSDDVQLGSAAAVVTLVVADAKGDTSAAVRRVSDVGRKLAMHIVAAKPAYLTAADVPAEELERETAIMKEQTESSGATSGKSVDTVAKIVAGRLNKRMAELCLLTQPHVVEEGNPVVSKFLENVSKEVGARISVSSFERWTLGQTAQSTSSGSS